VSKARPDSELCSDGLGRRVFHKVPLGQLELDDGAGSTLKIRLRGFEECVVSCLSLV
jgi:hypothetical protein